MKTISKIFALAVFCVSAAAFAADVKINDTAFPAQDNSFTKTWAFSTKEKAPEELKLNKAAFYVHHKYKYICGYRNDLVVKVTAPAAIKSFKVNAHYINYADGRKRDYAAEYSVDNKTWTEIQKVNAGGGNAFIKCDNVVPVANDGTVYIRIRKVLAPKDSNGAVGAVVLKTAGITVNF